MKITKTEIRVVDLPLRKAFRNSLATKDFQKSLLLIISTDEGITGISSIEPDTPNYSEETWYGIKETVEREFAPILLSEDPMDINGVNARMEEKVYGHLMSKSLVETALYDLCAKKRETSVYRLIGGTSSRKIPVIGWVGISDAQQRTAEARQFLDDGFGCIKFKISSDVGDTVDFLSAVRRDLGSGFEIRLDANQSLNEKNAKKLISRIDRYEISLLEQPINRDDLEGMASITHDSTIPIMADESANSLMAVRNLIWTEACDIVKVKVMRSGGIDATRRIISMAKANGIGCVIGNGFSTSLGTSIEASVYLASDNLEKHAEFVGPLKMKEDYVANPLRIEQGHLIPNEGHGFGYEHKDLLL